MGTASNIGVPNGSGGPDIKQSAEDVTFAYAPTGFTCTLRMAL